MSTITLPNIRVSSDLTVGLKLKDGGVAIDWSTLSNIRVSIYSDVQSSLAGRCTVAIDEDDSTVLVCQYAANKPQYLGVNRVIVQCTYLGETKTYDKPAFNFVRWTDDQEGEEITITDPDIDVEIEVEDVSSSVLQEAIDAALNAAADAEEAAHLVPLQVLQDCVEATADANEAAAAANAAGIDDVTVTVDANVGTPSVDVSLADKHLTMGFHNVKGETGETGAAAGFGTITASVDANVGTPAVSVTASGPDTAKNLAFAFSNMKGEKGDKGDQGDSGYTGAAGELQVVNNLTDGGSTAALSAEMGKTLQGEVSQLEAKYNIVYSFPVEVNKGIIAGNGDETTNANRVCTDYIDISNYSRLVYTRLYTTSSSHNFGLAFYDSSKGYISGETGGANAQYLGYRVEEVAIPSGAVYVRFTMWKDPTNGKFWFVDPERDAEEKRIVAIKSDIAKNAELAELFPNKFGVFTLRVDGEGSTLAMSGKFFAQPFSVIRIKIVDTTVPTPATAGQAKFVVYSYDSSDNEWLLLRVNGSNTFADHYDVFVPGNSAYLKIGCRAEVGSNYTYSIEDVTGDHEVVSAKAKDIGTYKNNANFNRADYKCRKLTNGKVFINVKDPTMSFEYQLNSVVINNDHSVTNTIENTWGSSSFIWSPANSFDYFRVQIRKTDGTDITSEDIATFLSKVDITAVGEKGAVVLVAEGVSYPLYGLAMSSQDAKTEFDAKPCSDIRLKIVLPIWMKVRFYAGLRSGRNYTDYYFNGDEVTLNYLQGGMNVYFRQLDDTVKEIGYYKQLVESGEIAVKIEGAESNGIVERNFDAEKYLGAILATPDVNGNLPLIVHCSDIHGDFTRFKSAFDYADYLGADILVNTGDNPFYMMGDGVAFHKEIVLSHKTDFANCIGNHDTYGVSTLGKIYDEQILPFADDYGYQKEGRDVTDKCYYFKDLSTQKIRIIALDIYEGLITANYKARVSSTQFDWFIATLASTPEGYGVLVIMHQAPHTITAITGKTDFNDSTMDAQQNAIDSDYMTNAKIVGNPFGKVIDAFIAKGTVSGTYTQKKADLSEDETVSYSADFTGVASGVEFIAYLNGHCHRDFIGYVADCEHNQLNLLVASANPLSQSSGYKTPSDIMRDGFGSNQDAINIYSINRTDKTVGIARIGSNLSKDFRPRKVMFARYADDE